MGCGIYKIKNIINNKVYIGSSRVINKRIDNHRYMLLSKTHDNEFLQKDFDAFGNENFEFSVIEKCDVKDLIEKENFYIDKYNSTHLTFGYNQARVNEFGTNIFNRRTKIKMSKVKLSKHKNFSKFKITNTLNNQSYVFDNLIEAADYFIKNEFTKSKQTKVRDILSKCLRGKKVDNGTSKGCVRKSIYKHEWEILN